MGYFYIEIGRFPPTVSGTVTALFVYKSRGSVSLWEPRSIFMTRRQASMTAQNFNPTVASTVRGSPKNNRVVELKADSM